jgi:hypothetical protein
MKQMKIQDNKEDYYNILYYKNKSKYFHLPFITNIPIFYVLNILIIIYLISQDSYNKKEIKKLKEFLNQDSNKEIKEKRVEKNLLDSEFLNKYNNLNIDKDMIGLFYPEINFSLIKSNLLKNHFLPISILYDFLEQLEIKLVFLEKEINATKINAFYTARTLLLKERNIEYDDANITELHNIVSWLVIHRSTQLKVIVSDKYLACIYSKMKLGIDLCPHRISVYNSVDEIKFEEIVKMGNVILKISNGNKDSIYIFKNKIYDIKRLKESVEKSFYRNFPLIDKVFSHCYSKKRIVLEKMLTPKSDLYEFKIIVVNNDIKVIYVRFYYKNKLKFIYYDSNYVPLYNQRAIKYFNISNISKTLLKKIKFYTHKLSKDFPNFIRVDLYLFHNKIYLSELTFDHREGKPFLRNIKIIKDAAKNWKRIDCEL